MPALTVYEKPTCTTCRKLTALLEERGVDFDSVEYHVLGLTPEQVREITVKTGVRPASTVHVTAESPRLAKGLAPSAPPSCGNATRPAARTRR